MVLLIGECELADEYEKISECHLDIGKRNIDMGQHYKAAAKILRQPKNETLQLSTGHNIAKCISVKQIKLKGTKGRESCFKLKFKVGSDVIGCESISITRLNKFSLDNLLKLEDEECRLLVTKSGKRHQIKNVEIPDDSSDWISIWNNLAYRRPVRTTSKNNNIQVINNLEKRQKDISALMADICSIYDIKSEKTKYERTIYRTEADPKMRSEILDNAKRMFNNGKSGYKKLAPIVCGLYGEQGEINIFNSIYDYLKINRRLKLNTKRYKFTGDGAVDFIIEGISCDVKYRNSTKNDGLAMRPQDARADVLLQTAGATKYDDNYFESDPAGNTHVIYSTGFTDRISFQKFAVPKVIKYSDLMDHPFTIESNKYYGMKPYKKLKSANDFIHMILTRTLQRLKKYGNQ